MIRSKKITWVFLVCTILSFACPTYADTIMDYIQQAQKAAQEGRNDEAIKYLGQIELLIEDDTSLNSYMRGPIIVTMGQLYYHVGKYDKSMIYFNKMLDMAKGQNQTAIIISATNNIAMVYQARGEWDIAERTFHESLRMAEESGAQKNIMVCLVNIGNLNMLRGRYDQTMKYYDRALPIALDIGDKNAVVSIYNGIGGVYGQWGRSDEELKNYKKALVIAEETEEKANIYNCLASIGTYYSTEGQHDQAMIYFKKSLSIAEGLGQKVPVASALGNIGSIYRLRKQYDTALEYYRKALVIDEEIGDPDGVASEMDNICIVFLAMKKYDEAIESFQKAVDISKKLGRKDNAASYRIGHLGDAYYELHNYKKAADYYQESIDVLETLRLTATGDVRRDYLSSQIATYQSLVSTLILDGRYDSAFDAFELATAKYLIEQLQAKKGEKSLAPFEIKQYQKKIPQNTIVLNYTNVDWDKFSVIVADNSTIFAYEIDKKDFVERVGTRCKQPIAEHEKNTRGLIISKKETNPRLDEADKSTFDQIIQYYRYLLSKRNLSSEEAATKDFIAREIYLLLFKKIEGKLAGKKEILILPGGVLAFIPFECLIMPDGHYLIETFDVKYSPSLTVYDLVNNRVYGKDRKQIIAFGGAVYDAKSYAEDMIRTDVQLQAKIKDYTRSGNLSTVYSELGYSWSNLPGTLKEVNAIKSIMKDAKVYTEKSATKKHVQDLSTQGELRNFRQVHFATHALAMPEAPDLSAIVLSQFKDMRGGDDGYLRVADIQQLDLHADFVNLSACETGLGKLYGGEGVVGLTQAFLVAGANSISVSLWQVSDESTTEFMTGLYELVKDKGLSHNGAMAEMKRRFIKSKSVSAPYFWAPFVYYGK